VAKRQAVSNSRQKRFLIAFSIEVPIMMMPRDRTLAVASVIFALCVTSTASGQQSDSHRVGIQPPRGATTLDATRHSERTLAPRAGFSRNAADSVRPADKGALTYPLYGALIGAGVGFTAAFIGTHQAHVKDHSEDGFVYQILIEFGAAAGLLTGIGVYVARHR
jgi:hypothetical protein